MIAQTPGSSMQSPNLFSQSAVRIAISDRDESASAVNSVLTAMSRFDYSVSDSFAVHFALTESLANALAQSRQNRRQEAALWLRYDVDAFNVNIEIQQAATDSMSRQAGDTARPPRLSLARAYMTLVEVAESGNRVFMRRKRRQGLSIPPLPDGYDFQI